jgi:CheY-like chemotaxis protein
MSGDIGTSGRSRSLRVLHIEDSELDHELAMAHLRRGGAEVNAQRVDSEADFRAALAEPWDVILSDFNVPGFSGLAALDILRESGVQCRSSSFPAKSARTWRCRPCAIGASDYLLKNNLARLGRPPNTRSTPSRPCASATRPTRPSRRRASGCPS